MSEKELDTLADVGMNAKGIVDDEELRAVTGGCMKTTCGPRDAISTYFFTGCDNYSYRANCMDMYKTGESMCTYDY